MKRLFIAFSLFIWLLPAIAYPDELLIVGEQDGPPKYYSENGNPKGFIVDITAWCMEEIGQPYKIQLYPWKRAYNMALQGEGAIIGLSVNSERLKIFDYSDPLFSGDLMIVVYKGNEFYFNNITDLKGKIIGVSRGSSYGDRFDEAVSDGLFELNEFSNHVSALKMLRAGRIDAILIGPGKYGIKQVIAKDKELKTEEFSVLPKPFKRDSKHFAISKTLKKVDLLSKFNAALKKAQESGVVDKIISSYYSD